MNEQPVKDMALRVLAPEPEKIAKNGKRKRKPEVAVAQPKAEPRPIPVINEGLRALVNRPTPPEPVEGEALETANVKFDHKARKWEVTSDNGTKRLVDDLVIIDCEFVVQPCKEADPCNSKKQVDVDCGHARGKIQTGKPKSLPEPTQAIGFSKHGSGFSTWDRKTARFTGNITKADYLILSVEPENGHLSALVHKPSGNVSILA